MNKQEDNASSYFHIQQDTKGTVYIRPNRSRLGPKNYMEQVAVFVTTIRDLLQSPAVKGVIYESPISDAEPDYAALYPHIRQGSSAKAALMASLAQLAALKNEGKPMVALIHGDSFGIQFSTALWADYRIATAAAQLGFKELKQGLFPGFGATSNSIRLLGLKKALPFLFAATPVSAKNAQAIGLVNEVVPTPEEMLLAAKRWIANAPDRTPLQEQLAADDLQTIVASAQEKSNSLIPAHRAVLRYVTATYQQPLLTALQQENEAWFALWEAPETVHMLRTFGQHVLQAKNTRSSRPLENFQLNKIGIIGAGIMGSGIAYEAARAGLSVVLKDVDQASAERGKAYAEKLTNRQVQRQELEETSQQALLARIQPTQQLADLHDAAVIIEAVFENQELKTRVTSESSPYLREGGIFASNTTSLPITRLASAVSAAKDFIGIHFFSPVDRMPLVEIIRGELTSDETLQKALLLAHRLQKIPIVIFDGPAFFTSRIFFNYLLEAISMLLEGIPASVIEQEAGKAGFAIGPLAVLDEISLKLMLQVYDQLPELHASQQRCYAYLQSLIARGREGRKSGKGFYDYTMETGEKRSWTDDSIAPIENLPPSTTLQKRLVHVMALDSYRCLAEGILTKPADADIGSVLGVGYPMQTGGVFGHIDQVGLPAFVADCQTFLRFGEQWQIPDSLLQLASEDFRFYDAFQSNWPSKDQQG